MATVKRKPVPPTYVPPNQESPASPHLPRKPESSSYSPTTPSTTTYDPHEGLLAGHAKAGSLSSSHPSASQQYIKWGIAWQGPTYMICLALLGISLALGHHFYFLSLDVTLAGSATRQQWSLRFGTGFSFLVVTCLKVASGQAYEQYMWTIIRRKSLSIGTLDRIFGLLSNPFGFFSLELFSQTRFVILLALICWCIPLSGLTPPATLSIVPGLHDITNLTSFVALNWTSENFFLAYVDGFGDTIPTPDIIGMASETSQGMNILPLPEPAPNSSFQLEFYGPSVQCSPANDSQNSVFDYYSNSLLTNYGILTEDTITQLTDGVYNLSKIRRIQIPQMLYFSAFAPYSGSRGWLGNLDDPELTGQSGPDQFNNWDMDLPPDFYPANQSTPFKRWQVNPTAPLGGEFGPEPLDWIVPQLWVQTTSSRMVCFLGNASYTINVEYVDGVQSIVESSTTGFELLYMPQITLPYPQPGTPYQYMSVFMAFTSLLSGNVTTMLQQAGGEADYGNYSMEFSDTSSRLLQTGLVACDEFTGSSFNENPIAEGTIYNGIWRGPIPWNNYSTLVGSTNQNFTADLFQDPAWMCRNGSLLTAIEDLANNITISMMSSPNLTVPDSENINVTYKTTRNIYKYDSRNLIISYSIAVFATLIALVLGFYSFHDNGVAHSTVFSAVLATTRNSELDVLSKGHSLGALPLDKRVAGIRLRFGELNRGTEKIGDEDEEGVRHIGFGLENDVLRLRRGGKYI